MPGRNLLGRCEECCIRPDPEITVTCVQRVTNGATLEGFEPCGGDAPGTCVRYRKFRSTGATTEYRNSKATACNYVCGEAVFGGETTIVTSWSGEWDYFAGTGVCTVSENRVWCQGPGFFSYGGGVAGDGSSSWSIDNDALFLSYLCAESASIDYPCELAGGRYERSTITTVVEEMSLLEPDTWAAARARISGTVSDGCCASVAALISPCQEGIATQVTMQISLTAGPPSTELTLQITFSDDTHLNIDIETDSSGEFEGEAVIPDPAPGVTRCYISIAVL